MSHLTNNFEVHPSRAGLYCVWVPQRNGGRTRLVSIWIDSKMTAFEAGTLGERTILAEAGEDVMAQETEDPHRTITLAAIVVNSAAEPFSRLERRRTGKLGHF